MQIRLLILLLLSSVSLVSAQDAGLEITLLHSSNVYDAHKIGTDGIGGTARVATLVNEARANHDNVLLLDGGDRYINPNNFDRNATIMNDLAYNGMALGNHEFNGGNVGVLNFADAVDFPLLAANIDFSASSILAHRISAYVTVDINGNMIGLIGLANEQTPVLSSPGSDLVFLDDEALVTQMAVDELSAMGINIIVLIAHREANENAVLASTISGVDVVVGGSDDVLLSNSDDAAAFPYPIETSSVIGEPVLIVQTPEGNRYFGQLQLSFDENGVISDWSGDNILLDDSIAENEGFSTLIAELYETDDVDAIQLGETETDLIGSDPCREEECTMGNLITDAVRDYTGADIAIYNSGGIRASIPEGFVSDQQIALVLPFPNTISTLDLRGSDLLAALEHSVSLGGDASVRGSGRFLQVSGLRFSWSPTRPVGSRIDVVELVADDGTVTTLDPNAIYSVATNDFIRQGGDEYSVLDSNAIDPFDFGPIVSDVLSDYIAENSPVSATIEGRITRLDS